MSNKLSQSCKEQNINFYIYAILYSQASLDLDDAGYDTIIPPINALHFHDHLYLARKGLLFPISPMPLMF